MRTQEQIQAQIDQTQRLLVDLMSELDGAPELKEPDVGSVIKFDVQYDKNGIVYQYVARRFGRGSWSLGMTARRVSWNEIVNLIMSDYAVKNGHRDPSFMLASKWKEQR